MPIISPLIGAPHLSDAEAHPAYAKLAGGNTFTGTQVIDGALDHDGTTVGFYGVAPATRPAALTAANAGVVDATYGAEEAAVIANLRTRLNELEDRLRTLGLLS